MNTFLHILGGFLIALAILWNGWLAVPALLVVGFLREQAQHRWIIERNADGWDEAYLKLHGLHHVKKQTFFGWITGHRLWEVAQWGIGGALAAVVGFFWL
jgi:hypothetical protein